MTDENVPDSWEDFCNNDMPPAFLKPIQPAPVKLQIVIPQPVVRPQPERKPVHPAHPVHPVHPVQKPSVVVAKVKVQKPQDGLDGNEGDDDDELEYELEKMDKKMGIHFTLR